MSLGGISLYLLPAGRTVTARPRGFDSAGGEGGGEMAIEAHVRGAVEEGVFCLRSSFFSIAVSLSRIVSSWGVVSGTGLSLSMPLSMASH
jgi:hypothetical protein